MGRYAIMEGSTQGMQNGRSKLLSLLRLYLDEHPLHGSMNFQVSHSRDQLFCSRSKDHLKSTMDTWYEAFVCFDENLMKSLIKPDQEGGLPKAARYPEVYVLICCDLLAKFAPAQYQTSQKRADLLCPVKAEVHSEMLISRFTEQLNDSVRSRAVSITKGAPSNTPVHGPLKEYVQQRIQTTAPAVTTLAQYSVALGEVELTQVMANWMRFETLNEFPQYGELYDLVYFFDQGQVWT